MKKVRIFLLVIFIFSISMIFFQLLDKVKSEKINEDLGKVYYSDGKDEELIELIEVEDETINEKSPSKIINEPKIVLDEFKVLLEKNKNTVGWLKIDNTNIDYPVVQGNDNDFYLNHDFYDNKNSQGSIFMDFRNRIDLDDKHTIIYGHHMKNRTMFNDLNFFKDEDFLKKNKTFTMKSLYREHRYEIFSTHIYENDPYIIKTRFNNEEFPIFLELIEEKAEYNTNVDLMQNDKILTLITCAYDFKDARYIVHAKKIS